MDFFKEIKKKILFSIQKVELRKNLAIDLTKRRI